MVSLSACTAAKCPHRTDMRLAFVLVTELLKELHDLTR